MNQTESINSPTEYLTISLHFNGLFSRWTWVSWFYWN